jgi:hypothetical protein
MWERKKVSSWGITSYDIHLDTGRILFPAGGSLYYCMDRGGGGGSGGCTPVFPYEIQTRTVGARLNATMCPHNPDLVAFVNSGDLWVTHLETRQEERLTFCHNASAEGVAEDPVSAGLPSYVMQVRGRQCFGSGFIQVSGSVSGFGIRIRNPDPDPRGQKLPTKVEKIKKVHVLKCWMFSFES